MQKTCEKCKRVIIEDWEKYLEEYPEEHYIECPFCGFMESIRC